MLMRNFIVAILLCCLSGLVSGQENDSTIILLADTKVQIEATEALNDLYNFKFKQAEKQFNWLKQKYGWHPLPYFLLGLSEWWKIMPNMKNTNHDGKFLAYMDTVIILAKNLYEYPKHRVEASFFLAAGYGFKGRLYSDDERKNWRKAATVGKSALKYMHDNKEKHYLSPELLFGDALYNYFSVWIPENYPILKPILVFFPKGDKELGVKQLKEVSFNAFYTRTEAQVFLMRILNNYENDRPTALEISRYLHSTFPDNPYFHRYYARLLYSSGLYNAVKPLALGIISKIDSGALGYEAASGRYASFFLGQIFQTRKIYDSAIYYYEKCLAYSEDIEATNRGYYHFALLGLGEVYERTEDPETAASYYRRVRKITKGKSRANKVAKQKLKRLRKSR